MKRFAFIFVSVVFAFGQIVQVAQAQQKLAQTGFPFLSVATDARAAGMGEAFTTIEGSSGAMFYNPAGMAGLRSTIDLSASTMTWIADIKYISGSAAFAPFNGDYGVIGLSYMSVDYGTFHFTRVANTDQGYVDIDGLPEPSAYAIGLGYARALSDRFLVGGEVKYVYQSLTKALVPIYTKVAVDSVTMRTDTTFELRDYSLDVPAFDFGTIYRTGLKSLSFGMSINNFSREIKYERESFQLPLTFKIGISMNMIDLLPDFAEQHSLFVSLDAVHPRSYDEYLSLGCEYSFMSILLLRAGYSTHHPDFGISIGAGVRLYGVGVDYSFVSHQYFNDIQRISIRFSL